MFIEVTNNDGEKLHLVASKIAVVEKSHYTNNIKGSTIWFEDCHTIWMVQEEPEEVKLKIKNAILEFEREKRQ